MGTNDEGYCSWDATARVRARLRFRVTGDVSLARASSCGGTDAELDGVDIFEMVAALGINAEDMTL